MHRRALIAALAIVALSGCQPRSAYGPPHRGSTRSIADGHVRGELVDTGVVGVVHDVVAVGDDILVLASSDDEVRGDVLLRSTDGGETWSRSESPLASAAEGPPSQHWGIGPDRPDLMVAGPWLLASRTVTIATSRPWEQEPTAQAVVISDDGGETWMQVRPPVPDGSIALVRDAAVIGDRLVLAGTVQGAMPPYEVTETSSDVHYEQRKTAWDAGAWWSDDPRKGFRRVTSAPFDARPEAQSIFHLDAFDGRLIATGGDSGVSPILGCCFVDLGPLAWQSVDGASWSSLGGLATASHRLASGFSYEAAISAGRLVWPVDGHRAALDKGSSTWRGLGEPAGLRFHAARLRLDEHRVVATWVENAACDCAYAFAGVAVDERLTSGRLSFDGCRDLSIRGSMWVDAPHLLGNTVIATATCNNDDRDAANLVWSTDAGTTWHTQRLRPFAASGRDLYRRSAPVGETAIWTGDRAVVLLSEGPADSEPDFQAFEVLPIKALVLEG